MEENGLIGLDHVISLKQDQMICSSAAYPDQVALDGSVHTAFSISSVCY